MAQSSNQEKTAELIKQLIEQKIVSAPQLEIAKADSEATGMALDEVLIARRWVSEQVLLKLAPWLAEAAATQSSNAADVQNSQAAADQRSHEADKNALLDPSELHSSDDFEENLQKYRALMNNILGEANK